MINEVRLLGNLGRDPEPFKGGCRLNVATTRKWTDKSTGEGREETTWHRVTVWGKSADHCVQYLSKGRQVYVAGRIQTSSYEKNGETRYSNDIVADRVQFLGGKGEGKASREPGEDGGGADSFADPHDDDIPW